MVRKNKKLIPVPKPPVNDYDRIIYGGIISILALVAFMGLSYLDTGFLGKAAEDQADNIIEVKIQNFHFDSRNLELLTGKTVKWTNFDVVPHKVVIPGVVSSPILYMGNTFTHTFNQAGGYDYHCGIHNSMRGSIIVVETEEELEAYEEIEEEPVVEEDLLDDEPVNEDDLPEEEPVVDENLLDDEPVNEDDLPEEEPVVEEDLLEDDGPEIEDENLPPDLDDYANDEQDENGEGIEEPENEEGTDGSDTLSEEIPIKTYNLTIEDNTFSPANITIFEDEIVKWTNLDSIPHKIKSEDFKDSGLLYENETYNIKFSKDGTYNYVCGVHSSMTGQIKVLEKKEAETKEVKIKDHTFNPKELTIVVGDSIGWVNKEKEEMPHSIVSDDFNSSEKIMLKDQTYKFTFDEAGDYTYNCGIHSDMQGKIKVLSAEEYGLKGISDEKEENKTEQCVSKVVCGEWSFCSADLKQIKTCVDQNGCKNDTTFTQDCDECKESWICEGWNLCLGGSKTRVCHDEHSCGTFTFKPKEMDSCEVPKVEPEIIEESYSPPPETTSTLDFEEQDLGFKEEPELQQPALSEFSISKFFEEFKLIIYIVAGVLVLGITGLVTFLIIKGNKLPPELVSYVKRAKAGRFNNVQIRRNLVRAGWKEKYINKALK